MAYKQLSFTIRSVTPLLMHRGELADPLDHFAQEIAKISGKRNKTLADHAEIARLEWLGSLWLDDGHPCLRSEALEASLTNAAKKIRRGQQAQAGLMCPANAPLIYQGTKDLEALWADPRFQLRVGVRVKTSRVIRTRPRFQEWACTFALEYDPLLLNENEVRGLVKRAGEEIGIGDWRPKFGRFQVEE
jgi:hypothetical protein